MKKKTNNAPVRALLEPLLRIEDLERLLRVDARTIRRLWKRGRFPLPLKIGGQNRWRAEEVNDALEQLAVERDRPRNLEQNLEGAE
jgi:predicted DNA-binding transcriptional regulator AlpA